MNQLSVYRVLTFILLPIVAVIGLITVLMLLVAVANPPVFLVVFLFASVDIYVISSFIFLQKGIDQKKMCNHSLRDWIRVNAIVSIVFCVLFLIQSAALLGNPTLLNDAFKQALEQQKELLTAPEETYMKAMKGVLYFFLVFSGLLLVHVIFTFRMLKTYRHMFKEK